MAPRYSRNRKLAAPVAVSSPMTREHLPAPLVYYPNRDGAFLAFGTSRDEAPRLCACSQEAVRNLIRLAPPEGLDPLDYGLFPDTLARAMVVGADPVAALTFRPGLCHRCNRVPPALRYCHEAEGPRFVQTYGWYINQCCLRLGIHPTMERYLPEICPPQFRELLQLIQDLLGHARAVRVALAALMNGPRREIPRSERTHWPNATKADLAPLEAIERQLAKPKRELGNAIQNIIRAEFGVRAVGEWWVRETELYQIICRLFPDEQVLFHHRPDWLDGLELDIYLPTLKLALEHQGEQHFRPIKAWGGESALAEVQARDARKAQLCAQAGIHLVTVAYSEPLTGDHIRGRIAAIAQK